MFIQSSIKLLLIECDDCFREKYLPSAEKPKTSQENPKTEVCVPAGRLPALSVQREQAQIHAEAQYGHLGPSRERQAKRLNILHC